MCREGQSEGQTRWQPFKPVVVHGGLDRWIGKEAGKIQQPVEIAKVNSFTHAPSSLIGVPPLCQKIPEAGR